MKVGAERVFRAETADCCNQIPNHVPPYGTTIRATRKLLYSPRQVWDTSLARRRSFGFRGFWATFARCSGRSGWRQ